MVSLPAAPSMVSKPAPPKTWLSPSLPTIKSLPLPDTMFSMPYSVSTSLEDTATRPLVLLGSTKLTTAVILACSEPITTSGTSCSLRLKVMINSVPERSTKRPVELAKVAWAFKDVSTAVTKVSRETAAPEVTVTRTPATVMAPTAGVPVNVILCCSPKAKLAVMFDEV